MMLCYLNEYAVFPVYLFLQLIAIHHVSVLAYLIICELIRKFIAIHTIWRNNCEIIYINI